MRPLPSALSLALSSLLLAGCAGVSLSPTAPQEPPASVIPQWTHFAMQPLPPHTFIFEARPRRGIYAAQFWGSDVLGYRNPNSLNRGPVCHVAAQWVNGIRVDSRGDLVVPDGESSLVSVYRGPSICGKKLGSFKDKYGQASDAATIDAATGTIVVANIRVSQNNPAGNLVLCSLRGGCSKVLKSKTITYYGGGVALAKNGDCWITSENDASLSGATLTYFSHCSGAGAKATGWKNAAYGGLIIDKAGNLISIDFNKPALWVYKGCNPRCKRIGGPFALQGESFYGNLNLKGDELAIGDATYGQVDVYAYGPRKLIYKYSFSAGLAISDAVEAGGFSPAL